jgi:hypothetical protein
VGARVAHMSDGNGRALQTCARAGSPTPEWGRYAR